MSVSRRSIDDLAVFGGRPAFPEPLHVGRPNLPDREALFSRLEGMLDRNWLSNDGPLVQEFEAQIAEVVDVEHCVAVCNGTIGLEIATRALGLAGEVIVPSFTFVATAHALQWQEIRPVFCDIDPATHTIDPQRVQELITPRTTGIVGVHLWGGVCEVEELQAIADENDLTLMFDAAHAFGCGIGGRLVGGFGRCEVLSFHATKFLNAFEGGAIVTDDAVLADRMRLMRNFGFAGYDNSIYLGINGKMTEVCAAMGLTSLEAMPAFIDHNRRNLAHYEARLAEIPGIEVLHVRSDPSNHQYVVAEVDAATLGLTRDQLMTILWAENVRARRYFFPGAHLMEPYRQMYPDADTGLPITARVAGRVLVFPTGTAIGPAEIDQICDLIEFASTQSSGAASRLPATVDAR